MREQTSGTILANWRDHHPSLFGKHPIRLEHTIHRSDLFTDPALIRLLENAPRDAYHVTTMDKRPGSPTTKREGEFGKLGGAAILDAVRKGHLWINFQAAERVDPRYGDLLTDIYREFEARVPGLVTFKHKMTILISSPLLKVKYHFDVPGQTLWQIRGRKRVYVYPASPPFLKQQSLEDVILNRAHETDITHEPWFDDHARVYDLEPGQMLHWPLNSPHRVENEDVLNVSFTTEHWTRALRNRYAVNYGNGLLRMAGFRALSQETGSTGLYPKAALTALAKAGGLQKRIAKPFVVDFQVDPDAADCVRDIPQKVFGK
ncbi:MAG: hypothetical protein AAGF59_12815 [Pseudomonadota bacterium]